MARFPFGLEALVFGGGPLAFADGPLWFARPAPPGGLDRSGLDGGLDRSGLNGPRLALGADEFAQLLLNLRPTGDAWPEEPGSVQGQVLLALAETFARLNARANVLVSEACPATTGELLGEWEASVGLPDGCAPLAPTAAQRRATAIAKLVAQGGASIPYLLAYAAALGSPATITQFAAFRADAARADDPASGDGWAYAWQLNLTAASAGFFFTADAGEADDPLASFQTGAVECRLRRIAPAQTTLLFHYASETP